METEEIRQHYMPDKIRLLLIGESPPAKGKFFYVKSAMTTYTSNAFEKSFGVTFHNNEGFLDYFMRCGCFLDDLSHSPVDDLPRNEREKALRRCIEPLSERIRQVDPSVIVIVIVIVLKKIERFVREAILKSGCNPEIYVLPFPGNCHQKKYIEQLSGIISKFLPTKT